jgi:prepilin-type N-terminal cleavage/methylation domain-containing protein
MRSKQGFTLAEIIIVVAIMSIIAGIVLFNVSTASKKSRDADRQADLRTIQAAVELYKQKNGRYPAGCRGAGVWSGQVGTSYACASGNQYIVGLAPEFIRVLPTDKRLSDTNPTNSGYVYTTNTDGTVYKIMAKRTVESEIVNYSHSFKSCDATDSGTNNCVDSSTGICDTTIASSNNKPNHCQEGATDFRNTYAVWGGFAKGAAGCLNGSVEHNTEAIVCDIP